MRLSNGIPAAALMIRKRFGDAVQAAGKDLAVAVKANMVPGHAYDTGYMHDHTTWVPTGELSGYVHVDTDYAGYVEYGTRNMSARPFLAPALADGWPKLLYNRAKEIGKPTGVYAVRLEVEAG